MKDKLFITDRQILEHYKNEEVFKPVVEKGKGRKKKAENVQVPTVPPAHTDNLVVTYIKSLNIKGGDSNG